MRTIRLLFPLLLAARLFGQYQYFFTDVFNQTGIGANWVPTPLYTTTGAGLQWNPAAGRGQEGPLIYTGQIPANGRYEIKTVLPLETPKGIMYMFIRADAADYHEDTGAIDAHVRPFGLATFVHAAPAVCHVAPSGAS